MRLQQTRRRTGVLGCGNRYVVVEKQDVPSPAIQATARARLRLALTSVGRFMPSRAKDQDVFSVGRPLITERKVINVHLLDLSIRRTARIAIPFRILAGQHDQRTVSASARSAACAMCSAGRALGTITAPSGHNASSNRPHPAQQGTVRKWWPIGTSLLFRRGPFMQPGLSKCPVGCQRVAVRIDRHPDKYVEALELAETSDQVFLVPVPESGIGQGSHRSVGATAEHSVEQRQRSAFDYMD